MPRPTMSTEDFDKGRAKILREAKTIVSKTGFAGLSMRTLAARVGLTPGALYRYFPSKQEMLLGLWQDALLQLGDRLAAVDNEGAAAPGVVRRMLEIYAAFALEDHDRFRLLFLENDQGAAGELMRRPGALTPYELLVTRVAAAVEEGSFIPGNPVRIAQALWAAVHGAVTLTVTVDEIDFGDGDLIVQNTLDAVMRGMAARRNDL